MDDLDAGYCALVTVASILGGAIASVSGFGIGSLLTPVLALRVPTKLAVAAMSVPHLVASLLRVWMIRQHIDRKLLASFGLMSAAGAIAGALLQAYAANPVLTIVFGCVLVFTGLTGLTGLSRRLRFRGWVAWAAGAISGFLGGLVGNQGGIRSAAMLGFDLHRLAFISTAGAVSVILDFARMPVYFVMQGPQIASLWPLLLVATAGAVFGTVLGTRLLHRIPEPIFRRVVSGLILALGVMMLARARH